MGSRSYPSKVLLFGEYVIIRGSRALAIPYHDFEGHWAYSETGAASPNLESLGHYLENHHRSGQLLTTLALDRFQENLSNGLYFESSIPVGYGLGSSGALVAAVYESYCTRKEPQLPLLKPILAQIESYFHGSSSGVDPLVCLLDKPLLLRDRQRVEVVAIPEQAETGNGALFLIDTGVSRETGPLVRVFLSKCEDLSFDSMVEDELGGLTNAAIQAFLRSDWRVLQPVFGAISQFQWNYFQEMIPLTFREVWEAGLDSPNYKLKLCGAGGGGFLLGITSNLEAAREELYPLGLRVVHQWMQ
ncbi:MAG: mevalonate kinase [Saprospirales bacterium]|nr:mevalonate kinase [Saprospirales bacterium]MBK8491573.1 mevalonate kinase [Saprospirales bacterium]